MSAERMRLRAKIVAWFRVAMVVIGALPWALPFARARLGLGGIGVVVDMVFLTMCHRRPERTMVFDGVAMPLCSRCAGIFAGVAIGAIIGRPLIALRTWRWFFALTVVFMATDIVTQDVGLHPPWHPTRIATGVLVGYAMMIGFLSGLARDDKTHAAEAKTASAAP